MQRQAAVVGVRPWCVNCILPAQGDRIATAGDVPCFARLQPTPVRPNTAVAMWLSGAKTTGWTPRAIVLGGLPLWLAWAPLGGCALVHNYDDPDGPRFEGHYSMTSDRSTRELTVATFNIQFAANVSTAIDEIDDTPALRDSGILLLQEMDNAGSDAIAAHFGYDYVYYPGSQHHGKDFGNAVLSRWAIVDDHKLILPYRNPSNGRIRIAVSASLSTPEGILHVYSVHSETPWLGPSARLEQTRAIADDAAKQGDPMLIGGDFNTLEGDSVDATAEIFTDRGYTWATKSVTDTVSSAVGSFTLDHIYVKGFDAVSAHTRETDASDHQPVWVVLTRRDDP